MCGKCFIDCFFFFFFPNEVLAFVTIADINIKVTFYLFLLRLRFKNTRTQCACAQGRGGGGGEEGIYLCESCIPVNVDCSSSAYLLVYMHVKIADDRGRSIIF